MMVAGSRAAGGKFSAGGDALGLWFVVNVVWQQHGTMQHNTVRCGET